MSITLAELEHPNGIVAAASRRAAEIIAVCADRGLEFSPRMSPWAAVELGESIAMAIMEARGYDDELLDMAIDLEPPPGFSLGDLDVLLERSLTESAPSCPTCKAYRPSDWSDFAVHISDCCPEMP